MSERPRLLTPAAYGALKGATAAAIQVATPQGSAEAFALDVAADLDRAAGKPILARALAQLAGASVFSVTADPSARLLGALKEAGEAVSATAQLASSGAWGLEEAKAARAEIREAIAAFAGVDAELTKRIEGEG